jgi:hypothetical protein
VEIKLLGGVPLQQAELLIFAVFWSYILFRKILI